MDRFAFEKAHGQHVQNEWSGYAIGSSFYLIVHGLGLNHTDTVVSV